MEKKKHAPSVKNLLNLPLSTGRSQCAQTHFWRLCTDLRVARAECVIHSCVLRSPLIRCHVTLCQRFSWYIEIAYIVRTEMMLVLEEWPKKSRAFSFSFLLITKFFFYWFYYHDVSVIVSTDFFRYTIIIENVRPSSFIEQRPPLPFYEQTIGRIGNEFQCLTLLKIINSITFCLFQR